MITLIKQGNYHIFETNHGTKIIKLDNQTFAWPYARTIGEILVTSHTKFDPSKNHRLTSGRYRLYRVKGEPTLTDLQHLELSVGGGGWQGYLLPTGFPNRKKHRSRIVPTTELITHYQAFYERA
jgi:hypothetical protein